MSALHDEEVFSDELSDAVLEIAGNKCWEGPAGSLTIAFCSGPETCPMRPAIRAAKLLSKDEARRIAANIAKLRELMDRKIEPQARRPELFEALA